MLTATFTAQYEGGVGLQPHRSAAVQRFRADYADKLTTLNMISMHRTDILPGRRGQDGGGQGADRGRRVARRPRPPSRRAQAQQAILDADQKKYETLLATLTRPQRTAYQSDADGGNQDAAST